jgi:hypothetical protein
MSDSLEIDSFPWTVIESPKPSFYSMNKMEMRVVSLEQGGPTYGGPERVFEERWKHTEVFYVLSPVELGVYIASSLHDRFHYQVKRSEQVILHKMEEFCRSNRGTEFRMIGSTENYRDNNILVVHKPSKELRSYILSFDNSKVINKLLDAGKLDKSRGNFRVDTGFTSGKSLQRDPTLGFISVPCLLENTMEPMFIQTMVEVSTVMDMLCREEGLPLYFRVDGIAKQWAQKIDPNNLCQQARNSLATNTEAFGGHLDIQNDPRPLMCAVPVVHRIIPTNIGPARHAIIGYTRKSCYEATCRVKTFLPPLNKVKKWYDELPSTRKCVSNDLFRLDSLVGGTIVFPVHCSKSVGLSPFLDGIIKMQDHFGLTLEHCVALCYSIVANESPYYFWSTTREYISVNRPLSSLSPMELGLEFHQKMWEKISSQQFHNLPKRHQPHNGLQPEDEKVKSSIKALLLLVDAMSGVSPHDNTKEFYHSKAVAILVRPAINGGCHAAGALTSQGLLHAMACLGLIPIGLSQWGEMAVDAPYLANDGITIDSGKADQFLATLSRYLGVTLCEAEQVNCKYSRSTKKSVDRYRDAIYPGQYVYAINDDKTLSVFDGKSCIVMEPPALKWLRQQRTIKIDPYYWLTHTRKKVKGGNRIKKKARREDPTELEIAMRLPTVQQVITSPDKLLLPLSLNNLLGDAIGDGPLSWKNIIAEQKRESPKKGMNANFVFQIKNKKNEILETPECTSTHHSAIDCKLDGILRYVAWKDRALLSKRVFRLIESPGGKAQHGSRDLGDNEFERRKALPDICKGYYVLHHVKRGDHTRKIAIVTYLTRDALLLALFNNNYYTEKKDCYLLHR